MDSAWMAEGRCWHLSPEIFFPRDGTGVEVARRICAGCPVRSSCLEYAMENHTDRGVWGGTSERHRRRLARSFRIAAGDRGSLTNSTNPAVRPEPR